MSEAHEVEESLVHIYMVQVGDDLYRALKAGGGGCDHGINAYLRRRLDKPAPVYPDCDEEVLDDDTEDDETDAELLNGISVPQGPRIPPHSVPIEGDLYDMLVEATATPEKKLFACLKRWRQK